MPRLRGTAVLLVPMLLLAGCQSGSGRTPGGDPTAAARSTSAMPTASPGSAGPPACPDPEGQACLGVLTAGTYTTRLFTPALTYTVPDGWANYEDTPGNFLLVPPGHDLPGVDAGTSDFIGVYTSVGPAAGCADNTVAGGVLPTPDGFRAWMTGRPGLRHSRIRRVEVGGLTGLVVDLRLARSWRKTCPWSIGRPVVPVLTGMGVSSLDHNVMPRQVMRLYLLDYQEGALAIEVEDVGGARHLDRYERVVRTMRFGG